MIAIFCLKHKNLSFSRLITNTLTNLVPMRVCIPVTRTGIVATEYDASYTNATVLSLIFFEL